MVYGVALNYNCEFFQWLEYFARKLTLTVKIIVVA